MGKYFKIGKKFKIGRYTVKMVKSDGAGCTNCFINQRIKRCSPASVGYCMKDSRKDKTDTMVRLESESTRTYYKIGEKIRYGVIKLEVIPYKEKKCFFRDYLGGCYNCNAVHIVGACRKQERPDGKDVCFAKVNPVKEKVKDFFKRLF